MTLIQYGTADRLCCNAEPTYRSVFFHCNLNVWEKYKVCVGGGWAAWSECPWAWNLVWEKEKREHRRQKARVRNRKKNRAILQANVLSSVTAVEFGETFLWDWQFGMVRAPASHGKTLPVLTQHKFGQMCWMLIGPLILTVCLPKNTATVDSLLRYLAAGVLEMTI